MALLTFPVAPFNGEIYPIAPPAGTNIYQWSAVDQTWRLLGTASGVTAGTYGSPLLVPEITVDATGRITVAQNVAIQLGDTTQVGLVQLVDDTTSNDPTKALTAAQGYNLQNQIGDVTTLSPPEPDIVTAINVINTPTGVTAGTYGTNTKVGRFTVNSLGRLTSAVEVPIDFPTIVFLDDVSASFNGTAVTFPLAISGGAYTPSPSTNLLVFVGGVPQRAGSAYSVAGSSITFTEAPLSGTSFIAVTVA